LLVDSESGSCQAGSLTNESGRIPELYKGGSGIASEVATFA